MSQLYGTTCHKPSDEVICRESDAMKAVVVMSYSGCLVVYNGYDIVNYSGCDLRNTFGVISTIQWM